MKRAIIKSSLVMAVAGLILAGCSQDEADRFTVASNGKAIEFRTVTNKARTTEMDYNNIGDFKVYASSCAEKPVSNPLLGSVFDIMDGVSVVRNIAADTWSYSPVKYLPANAVAHFYAYSPSGSVNVNSIKIENDITYLAYTVPLSAADPKKAEDFLVAIHTPLSNAVTMTFQHALSMATFKAKNTNDGATFVIEKIELENLCSAATLGFIPDIDIEYNPLIEWSTMEGSRDPDGKAEGNFEYTSTYVASLPAAGVAVMPGTDILLTPAHEGLVILPQKTSVATVANLGVKPALKITYSAYDGSNTSIFTGKTVSLTFPEGLTYDYGIRGPETDDFRFEMGKKYTFQFTFETLNAISFTVDVDTWGAAVETPVVP